MPRNCEKSGKLHILQLHHPAYCDLSSARRSPITLYLSFPKDDESQPCKVGSGENLPLLFVQAQFSTPYISMMFTKLWYSKFWKIVSPIWTSPGFLKNCSILQKRYFFPNKKKIYSFDALPSRRIIRERKKISNLHKPRTN